MVNTWSLKGLLYPYFGVYVCAGVMLGPFGYVASRHPAEEGLSRRAAPSRVTCQTTLMGLGLVEP